MRVPTPRYELGWCSLRLSFGYNGDASHALKHARHFRYLSSNCDKFGNSEPVAAVLDYPPHFVQLKRAGRLPPGVQYAIGAGPNLVSRNKSEFAALCTFMPLNMQPYLRASVRCARVDAYTSLSAARHGDQLC